VAVQEVQPEISEGIRSRIENRLVVPVEVRVSETGKVTEAVSRGNGDTVYRFLADQAVKAARSWRFLPARSKWGTAVASRTTLEFVFTPPSAQ
jgi:TonB family protein